MFSVSFQTRPGAAKCSVHLLTPFKAFAVRRELGFGDLHLIEKVIDDRTGLPAPNVVPMPGEKPAALAGRLAKAFDSLC